MEEWFRTPQSGIRPATRSAAEQAAVDAATADLALYHYDSCMFCARVRKAIATLALDIELRDVLRSPVHQRELAAYGGSSTVPCLRIGKGDPARDRWMYESADIIRYLNERFGGA